MRRLILAAVLLALATGASCTDSGKPGMFDCVIVNGKIIDGTGNPWFRADIGIIGDTIVEIGSIPAGRGKHVIDASGRVVTPGFIDIHTHTGGILDDPTAHNFIMQGVTTVVDGNCGGSEIDLRDLFRRLEEQGTALNYCTLIGQNSIRGRVMGNADREPTPEEMEMMKKMVEDGMKAGAVGLSSGLKYRPAVFAKTEEVVELARVAARYGGFYAVHMRSEGKHVVEAVEEAIEIGEKAGIPVQISHHKILSVNRWGDSVKTLELIDEARKRGIDVKADQYPYTASSTGLAVLLPPWALEGEGWKEKIKIPGTREKIKEEIARTIANERAGDDMDRIRLAKYPPDPRLEGKGLGEILTGRGEKPSPENAAELVLELLEKGDAWAVYHAISERDIERIMKRPYVMHASDANITEIGVGVPHPRCYGTFPRVFAVYVREKGILTLEEAVRKMTSLPAARIGIRDSGILSEGKRADIVIFDPAAIRDTATFADPHRYPEGIDYVIVNGEIVVDHGTVTGKLPGRIIYGPGKGR